MALFGAPTRQPDHAHRAARAALALQRVIEELPNRAPGWPRFRVGVNTGPALVGNIGSGEYRNYTAIGDTVNLAARLEASAQVGQVVTGPVTRRHLGDAATVEALAPLTVKGKAEPVEAYTLLGIPDTTAPRHRIRPARRCRRRLG